MGTNYENIDDVDGYPVDGYLGFTDEDLIDWGIRAAWEASRHFDPAKGDWTPRARKFIKHAIEAHSFREVDFFASQKVQGKRSQAWRKNLTDSRILDKFGISHTPQIPEYYQHLANYFSLSKDQYETVRRVASMQRVPLDLLEDRSDDWNYTFEYENVPDTGECQEQYDTQSIGTNGFDLNLFSECVWGYASSELPSTDLEFLESMFLHGATQQEIADGNGLSRSGVAKKKKRILDRLKTDKAQSLLNQSKTPERPLVGAANGPVGGVKGKPFRYKPYPDSPPRMPDMAALVAKRGVAPKTKTQHEALLLGLRKLGPVSRPEDIWGGISQRHQKKEYSLIAVGNKIKHSHIMTRKSQRPLGVYITGYGVEPIPERVAESWDLKPGDVTPFTGYTIIELEEAEAKQNGDQEQAKNTCENIKNRVMA